MGFRIVDFLIPALDIPLPPGGDDLHVGGEALDGQFKTNLVVAFAGGAVNDGIRALLQRDLRQLPADDGTGKRGAQQIGLVLGIHFQGWNDDFIHHFIHQIGDDQLAGTGGQRLGFQTFQLIGLPHIAGDGNDFRVVVVFLQPGNDDGGIQTARIGEHDFFNLFLVHDVYSFVNINSIYALIIHPSVGYVKYKNTENRRKHCIQSIFLHSVQCLRRILSVYYSLCVGPFAEAVRLSTYWEAARAERPPRPSTNRSAPASSSSELRVSPRSRARWWTISR